MLEGVLGCEGLDLGVEVGVVAPDLRGVTGGDGAGDAVVAAGGLDLGVGEGVDPADSSSSDLTGTAPSAVLV